MRFYLCLLLALTRISHLAAQDPFALGVRETPHLSPAEQQKAFKLPTGFEIQLIAAEPQIQKPLNMAFDGRGRLWVTDSIEYPYAAKPDAPQRDSIKVIEFDYETGKPAKITTFADGLNIPIGVLPYKNGCIAHSIPNIWYFEDTDGDDKCDKRTKLYGPFDFSRDTHGMENAFRRGFDGWIYACHGFNNDSHVKGADGHEVHLNSGNTFRFQPDGSRIEHFSQGQVNPFGMCFDDLFNIFTADCHSKPITQILRGGHYESFGKPHDGLGYVPPMMDHLHGSTAICGLVWVDGEMFPEEYRDNFLSGNVMTSRINRNSRVFHGSTIKCKEEPDFLSTEDPWFRPVDLQIGPDGALYIADFYNRIIGHYEVPLPHPGRDRTSGRIWRVVYKGEGTGKETKPAERQKDLTKATTEELIAELDHPTLTQRLIAADELVNRGIEKVRVTLIWAQLKTTQSDVQRAHCLWVLHRMTPPVDEDIQTLLDDPGDATEVVAALKVAAETLNLEKPLLESIRANLADGGFIARAAADALGRHPHASNILPLVTALKKTPAEDTHLAYVLRRAIRDTLLGVKDAEELEAQDISPNTEPEILTPIALGVPNAVGAVFCIAALSRDDTPADRQLAYLTHAARYAAGNAVPRLSEIVRTKWRNDLDQQLNALLALQEGLAQRGQAIDSLVPWAEELGEKLLAQADDNVIAWENLPLADATDTENPWVFQQRASADGNKEAIFYSSLVKGETKTGTYRSQAFDLPAKLSFWCAGHVGLPPKVLDLNYIRLRDAETNELLAESRPPRNDVAQQLVWDLAKHQGRRGYVELVDGDRGGAYAWLAVGRFSLAGLNPNNIAQRQQAVAQLAGALKLKSLQPSLAKLLAATSTDPVTRGAIGSALAAIEPDARVSALARVLAEPSLESSLRKRCAEAITTRDNLALHKSLTAAMQILPSRVQTSIAETLAGDLNGALALLSLTSEGKASAQLLVAPNVKQRLATYKNLDLDKRAEEITKSLPPASDVLDKLIAQRRKAQDTAKPNLARGKEVFAKNCAACHQVAGQGQVVGPQLDGIGQRGLDRILEDVLDPNRNVDVAFRTVTLALVDGRVIAGLIRREEGEQVVMVDNQGKELRINKADIEERSPTVLSLMPANVQEIVSPEDFQHLIGYLVEQKAKPRE